MNRDHARSFWEELKRRRVVRVALVYCGAAFVTLQAADLLFPLLRLPDWSVVLILGMLLLGLPIALVLAWAFELTPEGMRRTEPALDAAGPGARPAPRWMTAGALAAAAGLVILGVVLGWVAPPRAQSSSATYAAAPGVPPELPTGVIRLHVLPPEGLFYESWAVSRDGGRVVFAVSDSLGQRQLRVRALGSLRDQPLPGTEGAIDPFWSPDGAFIAFFADGKLKKIPASGGVPHTLAVASDPQGGSWHANGTILFVPTHAYRVYRVSQNGGDARPVADLDFARQEDGQSNPQFLPDGKHFLYFSGRGEGSGIFVGSLDAPGTGKRLVAASRAIYAPGSDGSGFLLYQSDQTLLAHPFDAGRLAFTGEPFPVAESPGFFAASENGVLVHGFGGSGQTQLVWFDRAGRRLGAVGEPTDQWGPEISPDGARVAVFRRGNVWIDDLARGTTSRLTFHAAGDVEPIWSPDGSHVVFFSLRDGRWTLYRKPADGSAGEELLLKTESPQLWPVGWSPDGRYLLFGQTDTWETSWDLWVLENPLGSSGERKAIPYMRTKFNEDYGQFSPDGRWIAYHSTEPGRYEVYVRPFRPETVGTLGPDGAPPGGRWQVSTNGGYQPRWRADGREIYYLTLDGVLMAASVRAAGNVIQVDPPRPLFQAWASGYTRYDVTPDGQRFLVNRRVEEPATPATVVLNWSAGLR